MSITTIGLDTAKSVFQIHAVDEAGRAQIRRKLRRSELIHSSRSRMLAGLS
jgi:transposase